MEKINTAPKKNQGLYQKITKKIFFDKIIIKNVLSFLPKKSQDALKLCFKKTGWKDRKKQLKEIVKAYIEDFGKHQEKLRYRITETGSLMINTNIFNINRNYLREFLYIYHIESKDQIELEKNELNEYLKVLPKFEFYLTNKSGDFLRLSKGIIPYDNSQEEESDEEEESEKKKYEMFYKMNDLTNVNMDFSNKDNMIERQKKILEIMNAEKNKIYYPLEFIANVNYWCIILCHGGYFAAGFFLRDKVIEHKSDHKYVIRKKAGQRQITKDKSKKVKTSSKQFYLINIEK
jgi:hypothetical protein